MTEERGIIHNYKKARLFQDRESVDSAIQYYCMVIDKFNKDLSIESKQTIVKALNNLSYLQFHRKNEYYSSYKSILEAANLADAIGYREALSNIYLNTGYIAFRLGDYSSAMNLYKKAFYNSAKTGDYNRMVTSFIDMTYLSYMHAMRDSIRMEEAVLMDMTMPDSVIHKDYADRIAKGGKLFDKGCYAEAADVWSDASQYVSEGLNPERYRLITDMFRAISYAENKDYAMAISVLEKLVESTDNFDFRIDVYTKLYDFCDKSGDHAKAAAYRNKMLVLQDSLMSLNKARRIKDLEREDSVAKISVKLEEVRQQRFYQAVVIAIISVFSAVLIVLLVVIWRSRKKLLLAHRELYRKISEEVKNSPIKQGDDCKRSNSTLKKELRKDSSDEEIISLAAAARDIMESSEEIYNHDFSLVQLAAMLKSQPRRVSEAIKIAEGLNFSTYLAGFRIREAARRLADQEKYGHLTIQAISEGLGFRSRSNFISLFKASIGMTPSEYIRQSRKMRETNE